MSDLRDALKPCPFCGGNGKMIHPMNRWTKEGYGPDGSRITCESPGCTGVGKACYGPNQDDDAIAAWNTRAALAQPEAVEPVAYRWPATEELYTREFSGGYAHEEKLEWIPAYVKASGVKIEPLYTTPPIAPDGRMRRALERCRTILGNMALEREGVRSITTRWEINHEPLRVDAQNLLPVIDEALSRADEGKESEGIESESRKQYREAVNKVNQATDREIAEASDPTPPDATAQREAIARAADSITAEVMRRRDHIILEPDLEKRRPMMIGAADYVRYAILSILALQTRAGG